MVIEHGKTEFVVFRDEKDADSDLDENDEFGGAGTYKMCKDKNWNYTATHNICKYDSMRKWSSFAHMEYFQVQLLADYKFYDFSVIVPGYTDLTLQVENIDFHVNKGLLASFSEYFYNLFFIEKCKENIIKFEKIDLDKVICLVSLASFNPMFLSENMMDAILEAKDKFKLFSITTVVEQYLIKENDVDIMRKIDYTERHNMWELRSEIFYKTLKTASQLKSIARRPEFREIDKNAQLSVFRELLEKI